MASLSDLYVIAAPLDHPEGIATGPGRGAVRRR